MPPRTRTEQPPPIAEPSRLAGRYLRHDAAYAARLLAAAAARRYGRDASRSV